MAFTGRVVGAGGDPWPPVWWAGPGRRSSSRRMGILLTFVFLWNMLGNADRGAGALPALPVARHPARCWPRPGRSGLRHPVRASSALRAQGRMTMEQLLADARWEAAKGQQRRASGAPLFFGRDLLRPGGMATGCGNCRDTEFPAHPLLL